MKICIVTGNLIDNYDSSFAFDQALALSGFGHDVVVLALDMRSIRRKRKLGIRKHNHRGIHILQYSFPVSTIPRKYSAVIEEMCFIDGFKRLTKEYGRFDIIHSHFLEESYIAVKGKRSLKGSVPVVVTEHSSLVHNKRIYLKKRIIEECEFTYKNADALIAVSESLSETIMDNFDVKCRTVYNVFDNSIFNMHDRENIEGKPFVFVSAGNLTTNKRMDLLIKVFKLAFNNDPNYILKIFGDGPEYKRLNELIHDLELESNVFLMRNRPRYELAKEYKHSNAFVLLSRKETFGVAYIEAMACGLPVISCRSGGPESFVNEKCGCIVEDDKDDIKSAMQSMAAQYKNYSSMEISRYAENNFSPNAIARQLSDIYVCLTKGDKNSSDDIPDNAD